MRIPIHLPLGPERNEWLATCSGQFNIIEEITESESNFGLIVKTVWFIEFEKEEDATLFLLRWL